MYHNPFRVWHSSVFQPVMLTRRTTRTHTHDEHRLLGQSQKHVQICAWSLAKFAKRTNEILGESSVEIYTNLWPQ